MAGQKTSRRGKHTPVRMCVICRQTDAKRRLVRLVRSEAGIQIDLSGKMVGRGAYLCQSQDCWRRAVETNVLGKALRTIMTETDRSHLEVYGKAL